jgi:hypothetical protein
MGWLGIVSGERREIGDHEDDTGLASSRRHRPRHGLGGLERMPDERGGDDAAFGPLFAASAAVLSPVAAVPLAAGTGATASRCSGRRARCSGRGTIAGSGTTGAPASASGASACGASTSGASACGALTTTVQGVRVRSISVLGRRFVQSLFSEGRTPTRIHRRGFGKC